MTETRHQRPDRRGDYGIDEPRWPTLYLGLGAASLAGAVLLRRSGRAGWAVPATLGGLAGLGAAASYLYTTTMGKFAVWREVLRALELRGNETVLDMGCGRGAVLLMAARLVPEGRAIGIDLWRTVEQSGNSLGATRRNAELEGVADRVELHTGDVGGCRAPRCGPCGGTRSCHHRGRCRLRFGAQSPQD